MTTARPEAGIPRTLDGATMRRTVAAILVAIGADDCTCDELATLLVSVELFTSDSCFDRRFTGALYR